MNSFNKQENDGAGLRNGDSEDNSDDSNCSKEDVLSNCSSRPDTPQPRCGKKTRGRVKIQMEFIQNKLRRYTTFSKRKSGIMKKAHELATLTGTQVMLLVASETGHVYTFATRKLQPMLSTERGKQLIQTCLNSPDPVEANTSSATHNMDEQRMSAQGFEEPELSYVPPPEGNKDLFKNCDISYPATSPIQQHLLSIQQQPPEIGNKEIVQKACDYLQQFKNNSQQIHHQQIKQEELMSQQTSPPAGCLPMNLVRRGGPNDNNNSNDQQHNNNNKSTITNHSALFSHPSMVNPTASSRTQTPHQQHLSLLHESRSQQQQQSSDGEVRLQLNSCSPSHDNDQHISRTAAIRLDSEPPKIAVVNTYTMLRQPTQSNLCGSGYSPLIHSSSVNLIGGGHDNQQHGGSRDSSPARKRLKR